MIPQIIEYLILQGQLTGTLEDVVVQNDGAGAYIKEWNFPEPQPDFEAIEATQGFQDYLNNREIIQQRFQAKKQQDEIILKAIIKVFLNQINVLRQRAGLSTITGAQLKQAIEAEIDA